MIVVKGEIRVKPEQRAPLLGAVETLVEATRTERGCEAYVFASDVGDPDVVHIFERWADDEALDAHMGAPHMAEFMGAAAGAVESVSITRYDVSGSRQLLG